MKPIAPPLRWIDDARISIKSAFEAPEFINEHRIWEGFFRYKWVIKGIVWMLVILGLVSLKRGYDRLSSAEPLLSMSSFSSFFSLEWLTNLTSGLGNYIILIAIEIIIFHFARRTMMIVTDTEIDTSWKTFVRAEKRLIRLALYAFCLEVIMKALASVGISMFGLGWAETSVNALIHSFYLGFAIIDNYNELYGMTLKQSHRFSIHYMPIVLLVGGILAIMLNIPFFGAIVGPVLCSVIGTLAMYTAQQRDGSIEWVFVEKEKKKKSKG